LKNRLSALRIFDFPELLGPTMATRSSRSLSLVASQERNFWISTERINLKTLSLSVQR